MKKSVTEVNAKKLNAPSQFVIDNRAVSSILDNEYTLSTVYNRMSKKTITDGNYIGQAFKEFKTRGKKRVNAKKADSYNSDRFALIFGHKNGHGILKNQFLREFWDRDITVTRYEDDGTTVKSTSTYNVYTNVCVNKGRVSVKKLFAAFNKIATMPDSKFNELFNLGAKYAPAKPKSEAVSA